MVVKKFQRQIENFICENCGMQVEGDGYTNHCPRCLWSKHVDVNPGDRLNSCNGLMKPIGLQLKNDTYVILHRCQRCGFEKRNKTTAEDSQDMIVRLSVNN